MNDEQIIMKIIFSANGLISQFESFQEDVKNKLALIIDKPEIKYTFNIKNIEFIVVKNSEKSLNQDKLNVKIIIPIRGFRADFPISCKVLESKLSDVNMNQADHHFQIILDRERILMSTEVPKETEQPLINTLEETLKNNFSDK